MSSKCLFSRLTVILSAAVSLFGLTSLNASADVFYVTNQINDSIAQFSSAGVPSVFTHTGMNGGSGIAFDTSGNAFITGDGMTIIKKFSPAGADLGTFANTNLNSPEGLAFDSSGNLYAANFFDNGSIIKFASNGSGAGFGGTGSSRHSLAFDTGGNLYASDPLGGNIKKISNTGVPITFATGLHLPTGIAFDSVGNLYAANASTNDIYKYNSTGSFLGVFANTGMNSPDGIAFDSTGKLYVVNHNSNNVTYYSSSGSYLGVFANSGMAQPAFIAIRPDPVPEPASLSVLGLGTTALLIRRRRRF